MRQCKSARITYHVSSVLSQQRKTSRAPRSPSPRPRQKRPILPGLTSEWCLSPELAPRFVPVPDSRVRRPLSVASQSRLCSFFDRWPAAWSLFETISIFCFRDSQVSRSVRKHCASRCLAFLIPHPPPPTPVDDNSDNPDSKLFHRRCRRWRAGFVRMRLDLPPRPESHSLFIPPPSSHTNTRPAATAAVE